jgi:endonuclease-3
MRRPAETPARKRARARTIVSRLEREYPGATCALEHRNALELLVATILSAQCTDERVNKVTPALFARYPDAAALADARPEALQAMIRSTGFFNNKTKSLLGMSNAVVERFGGVVPQTLAELVTLPGVGRKTANLVLILAHSSTSNICVDTHVHRISNRLGWAATRTPDETEQALYKAAQRRWWPIVNLYLVTWGQNVCRPVYPRCGSCVIADLCPKIGVRGRGRPRTNTGRGQTRAADKHGPRTNTGRGQTRTNTGRGRPRTNTGRGQTRAAD